MKRAPVTLLKSYKMAADDVLTMKTVLNMKIPIYYYVIIKNLPSLWSGS